MFIIKASGLAGTYESEIVRWHTSRSPCLQPTSTLTPKPETRRKKYGTVRRDTHRRVGTFGLAVFVEQGRPKAITMYYNDGLYSATS